jgi:hypothetical protein
VKATGNAKDFSGTRVDSKQFTLHVVSLAATLSRPAAEVGVPFRATLVATGGQAPYRWTATGGLPPGLSVGADGAVGGVPARAGAYAVTAHLVDANGAATDVQVKLVVRPRLAITTTELPAAVAGHAYRRKIAVRGGVGGLRWGLAGAPPGLKLAAKTGTISGTPTRAGTFRLKVRVRDALGAVSTRAFILRVR